MKKIYLGLAILASGFAMAQEGRVGVNTDDPSVTLEITPNATNAATTATSHEGILIPRVSRVRAANMGTGVPESTLVYINNLDGSAAGTTVNVDANGFYYFAGGKWVKMGAGSGSSTPATGKTIREIKVVTSNTGIALTDWSDNDHTVILSTGFEGGIALPKPSENKGRILAVRNVSGANRSFSPNTPVNNSVIRTNRGLLLQSDGTNWHAIAGF